MVYHIPHMRLFASVLFVSLLALPMAGQDQAKGKKQLGPPQNLKILKEEGPQLIATMRTFTSGLGVQCVYCHVQGNFASDENPKKEIARHMISMAQQINGGFPDGKMHVTCYTCHRGETEPKMAADPKPAQ